MKKFLCYDTNDAANGRVNVDSRGMLRPNTTVPSTNGEPYKSLVTNRDGNINWEDRLAYESSRLVISTNDGQFVKVSDEVPSWVSMDAPIKYWTSAGTDSTVTPESYTDLGNGSFEALAAIFIMTDNVEFNGHVFPKKGVYFMSMPNVVYVTGVASADSDTPEITWDGSIEIIKKIDEKFLPNQLILYAPEIGDGTGAIQVYKNEDASNLEYASVEEVQRAFLGRGVFIKLPNGAYVRASAFVPESSMLDNKFFFSVPM